MFRTQQTPTENDIVAALQNWADSGSYTALVGFGLAKEAGRFMARYRPQVRDPLCSFESAKRDPEIRKRFVATCIDNWRAGRVFDPSAPEYSREAVGSAFVV